MRVVGADGISMGIGKKTQNRTLKGGKVMNFNIWM